MAPSMLETGPPPDYSSVIDNYRPNNCFVAVFESASYSKYSILPTRLYEESVVTFLIIAPYKYSHLLTSLDQLSNFIQDIPHTILTFDIYYNALTSYLSASSPLYIGGPSVPTGLSWGEWPRAEQRPKFKIQLPRSVQMLSPDTKFHRRRPSGLGTSGV